MKKTILLIPVLMLILLSNLLWSETAVRAATFTVTTTADSGPGSLRQAILDANASPGTDTITFAIGAVGSQQTIAPLTNLPTISDPVVLDGWSQGGSGYAGPPLIELDGSNLTASSNRGFRITGGGTTVRGFVIHSFDDASSSAIWLHTADGNWITGNYIGVNPAGTAVLPNYYGIWINNRGNTQPSANNIIGTDGNGTEDAFEGNVIAGSIQEDVRVETEGNRIAGNYIGTTANGSAALPNTNTGIRLYASHNIVGSNGDGTADVLEGNLISGHDTGIGINNSSGHIIAGNIIGLDASGSVILGNSGNGIDCNASAVNSRDIVITDNIISGNGSRGFSSFYNGCRHITLTHNKIGTDITGSTALGNGAEGIIISAGDWVTITNNIISGNGTNGTANGITSGSGANNLTIADNIIGSDVSGTADLGNTGHGIEISFSDNQTVRSNQIGGNGGSGILVSGSDTTLIEGNLIGVQADGSTSLGNGEHGVFITGDAKSNTVISSTIAYNGRSGVIIDGSQAISNTLRANAIHSNVELGIDLDFEGVTPTDQDDVDTGPNGLQNHPAVLSATNSADQIIIGGVLDSMPSTTFTLEFFSNATCDPSGNGEGAVYLGSDTVTTLSGSGAANDTPYSITLPVLVPQGRYLTATATGPEGSSEFSVCFGPTGPVQDSPITGLTAVNDSPQVDHNPVQLTATAAMGSNVSYEWDPGDGSGLLNGRIVTHTYTLPGTYTAVVTATNSVSQESTTTELVVTRSSSLSGRVWDDVDGDGAVGPGETTFAGETVRAEQDGLVFTATTGSNGEYLLRGLSAGSYTLVAPTISGYKSFGAKVRILTMPASGTAVGQWLPYRAEFTGVRGRAWLDDDFDGRYDSGETLLNNHLVDLTVVGGGTSFINVPTDSNGLFRIDLPTSAGTHHTLSGDTPALYEAISRTLNGANENGYTANLNYKPGAVGGCVSGAGGATVSGLTLTLRDNGDQTLATTTTGSDGCYIFNSSAAQDAVSLHLAPAGSDLIVGPATQPAVYLGAPLRIDWAVTTPGAVQVGIVAVDGVSVSGGQSTVSGYEVHLTTSSGILTATTGFNGVATFESVTPGLITATVPLSGDNIGVYPASWSYDLPAGASIVGAGFQLGSHGITAECRTPPLPGQEQNGRAFSCTVDVYRFGESTPLVSQSLDPGEQFFYQPTTTGMYWIDLIPDNANALTAAFVNSLAAGASRHNRYPYFLPDQLGPISGEVWTDGNANGTRETGEGAAIGFAVELLDASGTVVESTTTDTNGRYHLYPDGFGTYRVRVAPPDALLPTTPAVRPVLRDPGFATSNVIDFGVALLASGVEGRVRFRDIWQSNASSVTVELRDPANIATILDTTTTGPTGHFAFSSLLPGQYALRVYAPNGGAPLSRLVTAAIAGTPFQEIWLSPDSNKPAVFVYADENGNGYADSGEGLPAVSVAFDLGVCGNVIDVNSTDSDGFAPADLVFPNGGCARVTGGLPAGMSPAQPDGVQLAPYDGSIVPLEVIAEGTVLVRPFWDVNGDGNLDSGEPRLTSGVHFNVPPSLWSILSANELSLSGPAGSYQIEVTPPPTGLVEQPVTIVVPAAAQSIRNLPIAFSNQLSGAVIGPNSGAVSGLTIELRDENNSLTAATTTGVAPVSQPGGRSYTPPPAAAGGPATASFTFDDVAPGSYTVGIANPPANMATAPVPISFDPANSGRVQLHLSPIDTISGVVYWDHDYNGRYNSGEPGTSFYDVVLLNDAGLPEQTVTPAADGTFVFTGLQAGVQYALTVPDLYDSAGGSAGNWLTAAPGWFERGTVTHAAIGVGNFSADNPNSLAVGQVYLPTGNTRSGVAGATVGYYQIQGSAGFCNAANPTILGQTTTDSHGRYRLPLAYIPGGLVQYCLLVLDAPGLVQDDLTVIADAAVSYALPGGQTIYDQALNLNMDIEMRAAAGSQNAANALTAADNVVNWSAFRDDNLNGLWDAGEFPLPGVMINSGTITATSGLGGSGIIALGDGQRTVTITPPIGYAVVGSETRALWLNGKDVTLPPIGFVPDGGVSGILFADKDGDGWLGSSSEFGLANVTVTLAGPVMTTTMTLADGRFSLPNLPDGRYTVSADLPAGYTAVATTLTVKDSLGIGRIPAQSTIHLTGALYDDWDGDGLRLADEPLAAGSPLTVTVDGVGSTRPLGGSVLFWDVTPGSYTVQPWWTAVASANVTLNGNSGGGFGLPIVPPGVVRGTLWLDTNEDGRRQPWESPLSGMTVTLDGGASVVTDENGRYTFVNVAGGSHTLTANMPAGLRVANPSITVGEGRGTAVGIAAVPGSNNIYLPIILR